MKKLNKKGFTIVELVIVIAVIAILAAVLIPTFSNVISNSKDSKAVSEVKAAYEVRLADDLATPNDTSDDVVYGKGVIYVQYDDERIVQIKDGAAALVEAAEAGATQLYFYNGTLNKTAQA